MKADVMLMVFYNRVLHSWDDLMITDLNQVVDKIIVLYYSNC